MVGRKYRYVFYSLMILGGFEDCAHLDFGDNDGLKNSDWPK